MPIRTVLAPLSAILLVALAACGPQAEPGYTPEYSFGFTQSCAAQSGSRELCTCIWEKIEANVPRSEFDALERLSPADRATHPMSRQIEGYAIECAANLPQPTITPPVEPEATP